MAFDARHYCSLLFVVTLLPRVCYSQDDTYVSSRATYCGSPDCLGTPSGACGYGEYGKTVNNGEVKGVSRLYKNGTGCGACYQVRCKNPQYCTDDGAKVVVTDHGVGHDTDFVLSVRAYAKLAKPNIAATLFALGVIDVEYRRVPCRYPGANLMLKIHEHSKYPDYIAIVILYQAGAYDITAVDIWEEARQQWRAMRKAYGAVWDMANPPRGALSCRFQVSSTAEVKWVQPRNAIPVEWKAGVAYDTAIQLT